MGLPHTRGGVSVSLPIDHSLDPSSPHPWGCFLLATLLFFHPLVFPTPVGVFPFTPCSSLASISLPHTRGGVSWIVAMIDKIETSSPHPWGCFFGAVPKALHKIVFPTPVGVFLKTQEDPKATGRLPHTRGGVSIEDFSAAIGKSSSPHPWGCFA